MRAAVFDGSALPESVRDAPVAAARVPAVCERAHRWHNRSTAVTAGSGHAANREGYRMSGDRANSPPDALG
jgi:hypothetical protein